MRSLTEVLAGTMLLVTAWSAIGLANGRNIECTICKLDGARLAERGTLKMLMEPLKLLLSK